MGNRKQPVVRFARYTDDWELRKLDNSIKVMDGDRGSNYPHDSDFFENGDTLFLNTGNVTKNGFKFDTVKYITKEKDEQLRAGKLEKNDFVLTSRGTLGNVGFYDEFVSKIHPKLRINSAMLILRNTDEQLSYSYLHTLLKGKLISDFMKKNQVGSAQPHITKSEFLKLDLNVPCDIEEQVKIGNFFSQLDNTIALHQRKLDLLKEQKKGFLQKMFPKPGANTPEVRFAGFTDDWEESQLSDGTSKIGDGLHGTPNYTETGDVHFINGNNLINGKIVITEETKRVTSAEQSKNDKELNKNTLLMSINGTIGNLAWYSGEKIMLGKSAAYITVSTFDGKFIYSYLQTSKVRGHFMNSLTGTTIKNLGLKAIRETQLLIPEIEEQQKIGAFFKQLDDTIALNQKELDLLKETKKGFLQKMFV